MSSLSPLRPNIISQPYLKLKITICLASLVSQIFRPPFVTSLLTSHNNQCFTIIITILISTFEQPMSGCLSRVGGIAAAIRGQHGVSVIIAWVWFPALLFTTAFHFARSCRKVAFKQLFGAKETIRTPISFLRWNGTSSPSHSGTALRLKTNSSQSH